MGEHLVSDHLPVSTESRGHDLADLIGHGLVPAIPFLVRHRLGEGDLHEGVVLDGCRGQRVELRHHLLHGDSGSGAPGGNTFAMALHHLVELASDLGGLLHEGPSVGVLVGLAL